MTRDEVYDLINKEREYQDGLGCHPIPLEGELLLLEEYVRKARTAYTETMGDQSETPTRDVIRKIAAIAVRCLEFHGAPPRVVKEKILAKFSRQGFLLRLLAVSGVREEFDYQPMYGDLPEAEPGKCHVAVEFGGPTVIGERWVFALPEMEAESFATRISQVLSRAEVNYTIRQLHGVKPPEISEDHVFNQPE